MRYRYQPGDPCLAVGCPFPPVAQGYCNAHYRRVRRNGVPDDRWPARCLVVGCTNPPRSQGYCRMHYDRWRRTGAPETKGGSR